MKLNQRLVIGLSAISTLRKQAFPMRAQDLAKYMSVSIAFLEQILRQLRIAGLVQVKRGPGGGYTVEDITPVSAYSVAQAVGNGFGAPNMTCGAVTDLNVSIVDAFLNTTV